jgi:hypothetical protein
MTCRELERLYLQDAPAAEIQAHRAACAACERIAADIDRTLEMTSALAAPAWSGTLREALIAIPQLTVSCEKAPELMALALEGELPAADRARLDFHTSRCEACAEAAATVRLIPEMTPAAPAPWLFGRIAATRPARKPSGLRRLFAPRAIVAYAYAAAIVVMVAGLNPADLAKRARVGVRENTLEAVEVAEGTLADRFGELQEKLARQLAVVKGRAGGYGRAALSTALALVMREESPAPPKPARPRDERGTSLNEDGSLRMTRAQERRAGVNA